MNLDTNYYKNKSMQILDLLFDRRISIFEFLNIMTNTTEDTDD